MKPGQIVSIELRRSGSDEPAPIADVVVDVYFHLNGRQRYGLRAGSTNASGRLALAYEDLETSRRRNAEHQPSDYKTRIEECDALVRIVIPTKSELERAYEIAKSFAGGVVPVDAAAWLSSANDRVTAAPVTAEILGQETRILVPIEPA